MKANELMLGDLLYDSEYDTYGEVTGVIDTGEIYIDAVIAHITDWNPIPLTPEILEKNGFITEEREGDPTFPYLAFIIENDEYRIEITWYDSHDVYEPNTGEYLHGAPEVWNMEILGKCGTYDCGKNKLHVHELQHALRLCGIEKTIEL